MQLKGSRFVGEKRDVELRDPSRIGAVSARTGLMVVTLSWRDVVHPEVLSRNWL